MKGLRELILDSAVEMLKFYNKKGDTFEIKENYLEVIGSLGTQTRESLKTIVIEGIKNSFFNIKGVVAQNFVDQFLNFYPDEGTTIIMNWIQDKVIKKRDKPEPSGSKT